MPSLEERVAYLEGKFEDYSGALADLRSATGGVRDQVDRLDASLNERINQLDGTVRSQIHRLDEKIDRHFTWLVGIQVAVLVAVVGALVGPYYR